ncbi:hypothetical protein SELMODRAFT_406418 [Selaginella moellendorffii]|uniref:Gnk2-homologous domain-containing protein n=1 Tax=Selaginella moellendorffii TaxID=88036 RepID=D8R2A8_SELML|nr:hypothetical protein SELMODRAFT_406418 [Selaginella moellendorffii]
MASSTKSASLLLLLALFIAIHHCGAQLTDCPSDTSPNVVYYNTRNTQPGSAFQRNLSNVYRRIINGATFRQGSISYNAGVDPDRVYGFSACFGGFTAPGDCVQCLVDIRANFDSVAPLAVGARMCSRNGERTCYLRYENYSF